MLIFFHLKKELLVTFFKILEYKTTFITYGSQNFGGAGGVGVTLEKIVFSKKVLFCPISMIPNPTNSKFYNIENLHTPNGYILGKNSMLPTQVNYVVYNIKLSFFYKIETQNILSISQHMVKTTGENPRSL